jgi:hypothetical protein
MQRASLLLTFVFGLMNSGKIYASTPSDFACVSQKGATAITLSVQESTIAVWETASQREIAKLTEVDDNDSDVSHVGITERFSDSAKKEKLEFPFDRLMSESSASRPGKFDVELNGVRYSCQFKKASPSKQQEASLQP